MPLQIEIESVDGQVSNSVSVQTCPKEVTGNYRVIEIPERLATSQSM